MEEIGVVGVGRRKKGEGDGWAFLVMLEKEMNPIGIERKRCLLVVCQGVDVPSVVVACVRSPSN